MKRSWLIFVAILIVALAIAWSSRGFWRDKLEDAQKPALPAPVAYIPEPSPAVPAPSIPSTFPTSSPAVPPKTSATSVLPVPPVSSKLPTQVNLAVPFLSQAPKQNWDLPYQEACEEASLIMVDAYFSGRTQKFSPEEGDKAILDLVAFEEREGFAIDINAQEADKIAETYFSKRAARVIIRPTKDEVRRLLALGFPVIVPADGKALQNPNFRNGGPPYHMLVIKGYLPDGRWITNDPGTRKGADYIYEEDVLWEAMRDWNGGNVKAATPAIIVMEAVK